MADDKLAGRTSKTKSWQRRTWAGLDNFKCTVGECIYDSFDEFDLERHYEAVHSPGAVVVPGTTHS